MPNIPAYNWKAQFKQGANWYELPDIQTVDLFRGRRLQIDDYSIDTATMGTINPSAWTTTPKLGDPVIIYIQAAGYVPGQTNFSMFVGRIRDVAIDYGFVPAEDRVTVSCEGIQADWGRAQLNSFSLPQQNTEDSVLDVALEVGLPIAQFFGRSTNSSTTFTGNAFELVNKLTRTEEGRLWGLASTVPSEGTLWWYGRNSNTGGYKQFNDGTGTFQLYELAYDRIEFRSSADNYYNEVTITPDAVAAQTATLNQTPIYGWQKDTLDFSTTQAADHANWVLNNFQSKNQQIASISFLEIEQTTSPSQPNPSPLLLGETAISSAVKIWFRGTLYYVIVEGIQISARPGQTRFTLYVSGQDQNAYLILDDSVFGKLNENKLGY